MSVVETIPGVTAMAACAAAVGRPLAEGREPLLVWPDEPPADAAALLELAPNVVFMKAGRHLEALAGVAERVGADAVAVRRASQAGAAATQDLRACRRPRVLHHRPVHLGRRRASTSRPVLPCPGGGPRMIWFVGAGPGDPELITVKGRRLLEEADVVRLRRFACARGRPRLDARRLRAATTAPR